MKDVANVQSLERLVEEIQAISQQVALHDPWLAFNPQTILQRRDVQSALQRYEHSAQSAAFHYR